MDKLDQLLIDITIENESAYTDEGLQLAIPEQGTKDWLELRKRFITATDATVLYRTFVLGERHYGTRKEDFYNYKHGINQKPRSDIEKELMNKGHLVEAACAKIVDRLCIRFENENKKEYTYINGLSYVRDGWAMASTDYMIFEDGKAFCCVEVKNTDSEDVFEEIRAGTSYKYSQLAWQMKVTKAPKGIMIGCLRSNIDTHCKCIISTESKIYKTINSNSDLFKSIHEDVCIKNVNPCESDIEEALEIADKIFELEERLEIHFEKTGMSSITASNGSKIIRKIVNGKAQLAKIRNTPVSNN